MSNSLAGASRLWQFCLVSQPKTPSFSSFHDWETSIQSMTSSCSKSDVVVYRLEKITISHVHPSHRVSITVLHRRHHRGEPSSHRFVQVTTSTDTHEQYCDSSTDLSEPWKNHNNGRESQAQEIYDEIFRSS